MMPLRAKTDANRAKVKKSDPIDVAVGARLRLKRLERGVSQSDLAKAIGLTFQQVQKYENGKNRISASMLVKSAEYLGVKPSALLGEEGEPARPDPALAMLAQPGVAFFLASYCRLDARERQAVRTLVQSLVGEDAGAPGR